MALKVSVNHEKEAFLMDLMQTSPEVITEALQVGNTVLSNQNDLLMNQNDPIFLNHVFKTLRSSDLSKVIEQIERPVTQENIFHTLASGNHFESCTLLVGTLEGAVAARLMLARSNLTKKSPLILALSSKAEDITEDSQDSEKAKKPQHPQYLVAKLFWETCEKAVLNNPSLMESLKVCTQIL